MQNETKTQGKAERKMYIYVKFQNFMDNFNW